MLLRESYLREAVDFFVKLLVYRCVKRLSLTTLVDE